MKKNLLKKSVSVMLVGALLCAPMSGCHPAQEDGDKSGIHGAALTDLSLDENGKASQKAPIPLSGFEDVTNEDGYCAYQMVANLADTYDFSCEAASELKVTTSAGTVSGTTDVGAAVKEGETVTIEVTAPALQKFAVDVQAQNHVARLPYEARFTVDPDTIPLDGDGALPSATEIRYQKRQGGTYVYLNNPEMLQPEDVGQAILRDEGLSGDVQVTWEHSNKTGGFIYLGYQLKNDGDSDVYVTVQNIGYQTEGEWLGQQSWSDYYNHRFELPEDYFDENGNESARYRGQNFLDYTPRVYQPMTYRIPAGKYIYVVGGTTSDAYNETNVAQTADIYVKQGHCTNAAAKFFVTGGAVTGTFYCYNDPAQVQAEPVEQGYITMRDGTQFGYQYKGVDHHAALIESNPVFIVNDETPSGVLPVTYDTARDEMAHAFNKPYMEYHSETFTLEDEYSWTTNINPQNNHRGIGEDMSSFECVTTAGETVVIDTECADGTGAPGNFGNWMIDYHDNLTLVNQGDNPRTFTINKSARGALMTYVADRDGKVLATKCTIVPIEEHADYRQWEIYSVEVPAHSSLQLTVSFLLMGNSYGDVRHWIDVE